LPWIVADPGADPLQRGLLPTVLRLPLLVPFFLWESLRGGIDVALRAFRPRLPLSPAIIQYRLRLPPGPAPVMMASLVSLMPGTLAMISGAWLRVHVLDDGRDYQDDLQRLEEKVARVFGVALARPRARLGRDA
jgi:multicomponent Na+:H+ antiporter subunit E